MRAEVDDPVGDVVGRVARRPTRTSRASGRRLLADRVGRTRRAAPPTLGSLASAAEQRRTAVGRGRGACPETVGVVALRDRNAIADDLGASRQVEQRIAPAPRSGSVKNQSPAAPLNRGSKARTGRAARRAGTAGGSCGRARSGRTANVVQNRYGETTIAPYSSAWSSRWWKSAGERSPSFIHRAIRSRSRSGATT